MQNEKNKYVVIVIPVYKEMDAFEIISLRQVLRVLGRYDICLVAPISMNLSSYFKYHKFLVQRFDDVYFSSIDKYNDLLLSVNFYQAFSKYEYMLVYQLDGFVFSDRLSEFCQLGFDYIGAPIPRIEWPHMPSLVGNGGVSLRRISKCIGLLEDVDINEVRAQTYWKSKTPEDAFFSWCAACPEYDFSAPSYEVAQSFAVDHDTHHFYRKVEENLPFANHAWARTDYHFWRPIIERFGYHVPPAKVQNRIPAKVKKYLFYLIERFLRSYDDFERKKRIVDALLPLGCYIVWGYGRRGKRCVKLLKLYGIDIREIFDQSISPNRVAIGGMIINRPTKERIETAKGRLIITPLEREDDIVRDLVDHGYKSGKDFFTWSDVSCRLAQAYVRTVLLRR